MQHLDDAPKDLFLPIVDWEAAHFLGCPQQSSEHFLLDELRRFRRRQENGYTSKEWTPFFIMCFWKKGSYNTTNDLSQRATYYKVGAAYIKALAKQDRWVKTLDFPIVMYVFAHLNFPESYSSSEILIIPHM